MKLIAALVAGLLVTAAAHAEDGCRAAIDNDYAKVRAVVAPMYPDFTLPERVRVPEDYPEAVRHVFGGMYDGLTHWRSKHVDHKTADIIMNPRTLCDDPISDDRILFSEAHELGHVVGGVGELEAYRLGTRFAILAGVSSDFIERIADHARQIKAVGIDGYPSGSAIADAILEGVNDAHAGTISRSPGSLRLGPPRLGGQA